MEVCPGVPFILVGVNDETNDNEMLGGAVEMGEKMEWGKKFAKDMYAERYLECDLATMKGVKTVFDEVSSHSCLYFPLLLLDSVCDSRC